MQPHDHYGQPSEDDAYGGPPQYAGQPPYGQPPYGGPAYGPAPVSYGPGPYGPGPYGPGPYGYGQPAPTNGLGVAGFVCGLLGLILFWVPIVGIVLGLLGIVLGGAGMSSGKNTGAGNGLAVSGLVLGLVSMVPAIIVLAAIAGS